MRLWVWNGKSAILTEPEYWNKMHETDSTRECLLQGSNLCEMTSALDDNKGILIHFGKKETSTASLELVVFRRYSYKAMGGMTEWSGFDPQKQQREISCSQYPNLL